MIKRRQLLQMGSLGFSALLSPNIFAANKRLQVMNRKNINVKKPLVISTWDAGIAANKAAWEILKKHGRALDAVEAGVMVTESENNCCVGLNANPDRDGHVTLDACIMDEHGNAGSVCFLERIKHPISVARRVMEKTPHVMLVGVGAQEFALQQGFSLEPDILSKDAEKAYQEWLKKSEYKPVINIENKKGQNAFAPARLSNGAFNHDTIGMVAIDAQGNLSGSCTTSGMAFKMRGRVGDSPIIGAGLFVDNEVGAATATGVGEEVIKICGTHMVVEAMRHGVAPEEACKLAAEKIIKRHTTEALKNIQVAFIAVDKQGNYGAFAIQKGFQYAVCYADDHNELIDGKTFIVIMTLEIAVFNIQSALLAAKAGADRIELCENPAEGGTTPSYGTLKTVKEKITIPVFPIMRANGGDFFYNEDEFAVMQKDVLLCKQLGFEGVVIGLLHKDATIDMERTKRLVELAYPLEVTFHRAFDRVKDPLQALEDVIACGCQRILTSGQVPNAFDGKDLIRQLIDKADDRIIIMPGSGVRSSNIKELAAYTGATELHSSARKSIASTMEFINENMQERLHNIAVDEDEVRKMKAALK